MIDGTKTPLGQRLVGSGLFHRGHRGGQPLGRFSSG